MSWDKEEKRDHVDEEDELIFFEEETEKKPEAINEFTPERHLELGDDRNWKILVVDDEEDIHTVTHLTLDDFVFEGKPVKILDAYSAAEAFEKMQKEPGIAIMLLDVVMETTTSGLDLVQRIREELRDHFIRIVLRTGQPGYAPEREVVINYDINDYKSKTELTSEKIFTLVTSGLRSYKSLLKLESYRRELQEKVDNAVESIREKDHIIIKQSKQSAISELISNISHQWRQPLNTVMALIQDLEYCGQQEELSVEYLEKQSSQAMAIIQEMSETIDDLRYFFEPVEECLEFDIGEVLRHCEKLLAPALSEEDIRLEIEIEEGLQAKGYRNDYAQAILQIINNSREALKEASRDIKQIRIIGSHHKGHSQIRITDNGCGIKKEVIDHVFEPYFTTKFKSPGRGLSLYMCQIVIEKNMKGHIRAIDLGEGAEFIIEV